MITDAEHKALIDLLHEVARSTSISQEYFNTEEALKYMRNTISRGKLQEAIRNGEIQVSQPGDKQLLFKRADIDAFIQAKRKNRNRISLK